MFVQPYFELSLQIQCSSMATKMMASASMNEPQSTGEKSVRELWSDAAEEFERICKRSLREGEIRSFDDLQNKIEQTQDADENIDDAQKTKRSKAKEMGLKSLKYLKVLVGVAAQASSLVGAGLPRSFSRDKRHR